MSATDLHPGPADRPPERPPDGPAEVAGGAGWTAVCDLESIVVDTGVAALVDDHQVAVFRLADGRVFAIDHHDPCSGANVLARGIVGDVDGEPVVASPVLKQRFALRTGACLDDDATVRVHCVRVRGGVIEVAVTAGPTVA